MPGVVGWVLFDLDDLYDFLNIFSRSMQKLRAALAMKNTVSS